MPISRMINNLIQSFKFKHLFRRRFNIRIIYWHRKKTVLIKCNFFLSKKLFLTKCHPRRFENSSPKRLPSDSSSLQRLQLQHPSTKIRIPSLHRQSKNEIRRIRKRIQPNIETANKFISTSWFLDKRIINIERINIKRSKVSNLDKRRSNFRFRQRNLTRSNCLISAIARWFQI